MHLSRLALVALAGAATCGMAHVDGPSNLDFRAELVVGGLITDLGVDSSV